MQEAERDDGTTCQLPPFTGAAALTDTSYAGDVPLFVSVTSTVITSPARRPVAPVRLKKSAVEGGDDDDDTDAAHDTFIVTTGKPSVRVVVEEERPATLLLSFHASVALVCSVRAVVISFTTLRTATASTTFADAFEATGMVPGGSEHELPLTLAPPAAPDPVHPLGTEMRPAPAAPPDAL